MDSTEESSLKNSTHTSTDGTSRSLTDRLPMGPIIAAGRFMSCLSKQPRNITTTRSYTISADSHEKLSFFKPLSKRITSTRNRSSTTSNSTSFDDISSPNMRNSTTTPSSLNQISKTITIPTLDTVGLDFNFDSTYVELRELAERNCQYFSQQKTDVCKRFEHLLIQLLHSIDLSMPLLRYLTDNFHYFDYSPEV
jgi:hypothetical protein